MSSTKNFCPGSVRLEKRPFEYLKSRYNCIKNKILKNKNKDNDEKDTIKNEIRKNLVNFESEIRNKTENKLNKNEYISLIRKYYTLRNEYYNVEIDKNAEEE